MNEEGPDKDWCGLYKNGMCDRLDDYTECETYKIFDRILTDGEERARERLE